MFEVYKRIGRVVDTKMDRKTKEKRILLVDDNANVLAVLSDFLESAGYTVCKAEDAEGAMRVVKEELPHLALIDLRMPGMNGIDLMLPLKKEKSQLPVIIYSGYPSINTAIEAIKNGAEDYIPQPFKLDELSARIKKTLNK